MEKERMVIDSIKKLIQEIREAKSECRNGFTMSALMETEDDLHEALRNFDAVEYATTEFGPSIRRLKAQARRKPLHALINP